MPTLVTIISDSPHLWFRRAVGDGFQRVELDGTTRRGLLTHASCLPQPLNGLVLHPLSEGRVLEELKKSGAAAAAAKR